MEPSQSESEPQMISVHLFAGVREALGTDCVLVPCGSMGSAAELKDFLVHRYPEVAPLVRRSRVASGHAFVGEDDRLDSAIEAGTTIALIPPVSGG